MKFTAATALSALCCLSAVSFNGGVCAGYPNDIRLVEVDFSRSLERFLKMSDVLDPDLYISDRCMLGF